VIFALTQAGTVHGDPIHTVPGTVCSGLCLSSIEFTTAATCSAARLVQGVQRTQVSNADALFMLWF